jgi:fibronectin-binding autotransporter adhesin
MPPITLAQSIRHLTLRTASAVAIFGALTAFGVTFTWDGGGADAKFTTAANWNPDGAMTVNGNDIVFSTLASPFQTNADVDLTGNFNSITFSATASAMTITNSGNSMQFASGTATPIVNNSAVLQTFNTSATRQFWIGGTTNRAWNANAGGLQFNSVLFRPDSSVGTSVTLELTGGNNGTINGPISLEGSWTGKQVGIIKNGNGVWTFGGASGNSYNGATTINAGSLDLAKSAGAAIPGAVFINGTGNAKMRFAAPNQVNNSAVITFGLNSSTRFQLQGFNGTVAGVNDLGGTGNRIVEAANDNTPGAPATLTLNPAANTTNTFGGYVRDAAGSSAGSILSLIKNGAGVQIFTASSTLASWSGPTTISAGTLEFSGANGGGNSDITMTGGTLRFSGGGTRTKLITGTGTLAKSGNNTLTLTASNTFAGNVAVAQGTLALTAGTMGLTTNSWNITNGSTVVIGGATVTHSNSLNVDGFYVGNGSVGTLNVTNGSLSVTGSAGRGLVVGFAAANGTVMTVNGANASVTTDNLVVGWNTDSTLTLTSGTIEANTVRHQDGGTSTLNLDGGTLTANTVFVQSGNGNAALVFGGGVLKARLNNTNLIDNGTAANQLAVTIKNAGAIVDTDGKNVAVLRPLENFSGHTGSLTKRGAGKLLLAAANTYSGNTIISNGVLALTNSGAISSSPVIAVASGGTFDVSAVAFTLGANQTLTGNGTVTGAATISGSIAPGDSIGTLTFDNAPALGGTIVAEIDRNNGSPIADKINFIGGATLGGTLTVTNVGLPAQNGDTFDLFDGAVTGTFTTLNIPAGGLNHWSTNNLVVNGTISFTNNNPVALNLTAGVDLGGSISLPVIGGKNPPIDADNDSLTVTAVGVPSSGTAGFTSSNVTYTANGTAGTNTFTYTVSDAFGGTDTKTVTIIVTSPQGFNLLSGPTSLGGGLYQLNYLGIPGLQYALDESPDLVAPYTWHPVVTNTASGSGSISYTAPLSYPSGSFRTRYVP